MSAFLSFHFIFEEFRKWKQTQWLNLRENKKIVLIYFSQIFKNKKRKKTLPNQILKSQHIHTC